jgi:hypothetical protein
MACIVRVARLLKSESTTPVIDLQRQFVQDNVKKMLSKLYEQIWELEAEYLRDQSALHLNGNDTNLSRLVKTWAKELYGLGERLYVVGPMGERPIHVCALAVAKHRGSGETHIAEGILSGMKDFVDATDTKNAAALYEPFGQDYCAAVAGFLQRRKSENDPIHDLPYVGQIVLWVKKHSNSKIIQLGMYEAETVHFPLIACGYKEAVDWLVKKDVERSQAATESAYKKEWSGTRFSF